MAVGPCGGIYTGSILLHRMTVDDQTPLDRAMARFAAGDDAALGEVYDLASPAVFKFLLRVCRDRPLAEDLTQETFLRIHRARGLYRTGAAVMPWAYTIARRLFLDAVRARRIETLQSVTSRSIQEEGEPPAFAERPAFGTPEGGGRSPEDLLADRELSRVVDDALAIIPEKQAAAFRLLKGEGLSVAETAAVMGTTKGAVKLRAHRAYEALRGILGLQLSGANGKRDAGGGAR